MATFFLWIKAQKDITRLKPEKRFVTRKGPHGVISYLTTVYVKPGEEPSARLKQLGFDPRDFPKLEAYTSPQALKEMMEKVMWTFNWYTISSNPTPHNIRCLPQEYRKMWEESRKLEEERWEAKKRGEEEKAEMLEKKKRELLEKIVVGWNEEASKEIRKFLKGERVIVPLTYTYRTSPQPHPRTADMLSLYSFLKAIAKETMLDVQWADLFVNFMPFASSHSDVYYPLGFFVHSINSSRLKPPDESFINREQITPEGESTSFVDYFTKYHLPQALRKGRTDALESGAYPLKIVQAYKLGGNIVLALKDITMETGKYYGHPDLSYWNAERPNMGNIRIAREGFQLIHQHLVTHPMFKAFLDAVFPKRESNLAEIGLYASARLLEDLTYDDEGGIDGYDKKWVTLEDKYEQILKSFEKYAREYAERVVKKRDPGFKYDYADLGDAVLLAATLLYFMKREKSWGLANSLRAEPPDVLLKWFGRPDTPQERASLNEFLSLLEDASEKIRHYNSSLWMFSFRTVGKYEGEDFVKDFPWNDTSRWTRLFEEVQSKTDYIFQRYKETTKRVPAQPTEETKEYLVLLDASPTKARIVEATHDNLVNLTLIPNSVGIVVFGKEGVRDKAFGGISSRGDFVIYDTLNDPYSERTRQIISAAIRTLKEANPQFVPKIPPKIKRSLEGMRSPKLVEDHPLSEVRYTVIDAKEWGKPKKEQS